MWTQRDLYPFFYSYIQGKGTKPCYRPSQLSVRRRNEIIFTVLSYVVRVPGVFEHFFFNCFKLIANEKVLCFQNSSGKMVWKVDEATWAQNKATTFSASNRQPTATNRKRLSFCDAMTWKWDNDIFPNKACDSLVKITKYGIIVQILSLRGWNFAGLVCCKNYTFWLWLWCHHWNILVTRPLPS